MLICLAWGGGGGEGRGGRERELGQDSMPTKGSVMVPHRCNREPILVLHQVLVSGPITALAAASQLAPGYSFREAHVRPLRWTQGGSART